MNTATLKNDALLPQAPGGHAPGAVMAVLVHLGLITALTVGVDWRAREPEVVSAELWAAVPQTAAPPPPEVAPSPPPPPAPVPAPPPPPAAQAEPPPPREADIALEQERRRKLEADRKKAEQAAADLADKRAREKAAQQAEADRKKAAEQAAKDKQAQAEADRKKRDAERLAREKADDERLARQREENLRRMMGQAGGSAGQTASTGTAAQTAAPSASYGGKVKAAVRPNIVFTGNMATTTAAEVEVTSAPGGSIISRRLSRSSGNSDWDEAVLRAIDKTQAMPRDIDGRVPAKLIISFRPNE